MILLLESRAQVTARKKGLQNFRCFLSQSLFSPAETLFLATPCSQSLQKTCRTKYNCSTESIAELGVGEEGWAIGLLDSQKRREA
jgi:hypothetical protein